MTPSPWLYDFLKARTPFRPTAWRAHRKAPWTIGYGFTGHLTPGCEVLAGATITTEDAEKLLSSTIDTAGVLVEAAHIGELIGQGQFDVLVALVFAGL